MPHIKDHVIIPRNLGKDFRTRHGCECKDEFKYKKKVSNKYYTAKNRCVTGEYDEPWCRTKDKCGKKEGSSNEKSWDFCLKDKRDALLEGAEITYGKNYFKKNLLGILIFYIIFVITIPIFLYKFHFHEILEVYMPNFDLIATAVSFQDGVLGNSFFQELYGDDNDNMLGWLSSLSINYLSLLGLTYLVARRVKLTGSLVKGWGFGFVMLLLTYLVPNVFITYIQNKFADYLQGNFLDPKQVDEIMGDPSKETFWPFGISNISVLVVGLSVASLFIITEAFLLKHHKVWLDPFVKRVMLIDDIIESW